ncbi:uncharacterized protein [Ptychodera flava]|uniref:uncharacterized protein n=1 Tax=Ptychodera flava TaxID=63121 RepID=UPI00396A70B7
MKTSLCLVLVLAFWGVECMPFGQSANNPVDDGLFGTGGLFGGGLQQQERQGPPPLVRAALMSRLAGVGGLGGLSNLLPTMHCREGTLECGRSITERVHVGDDGRPQFEGGPLRAFLDRAPVFCHPGSKGCGVHINYHVYLNPKPLGGVWERSLGDAKIFRARRGPPVICADGNNCGGRSEVMVHGQSATALKQSHMEHSDTYSFVVHGAGLEIYDPDSGQVRIDFHKGLVEAVCKIAGKKCVGFYDSADHCFSHGTDAGPHAGVGLLDGWYDGCLGWADTPFRHLSVDFSDAYLEFPKTDATFYVAKGNPHAFDPTHLADFKIGILTPWASDFHCLRNHHKDTFNELTREKVLFADHKIELRRMLVTGEIDAAFVNELVMAGVMRFEGAGIETMGETIQCPTNPVKNRSTVHMITRRGSEVLSWWNDAFKQFKDSGNYYKLCRETSEHTGHTPGCLD